MNRNGSASDHKVHVDMLTVTVATIARLFNVYNSQKKKQ